MPGGGSARPLALPFAAILAGSELLYLRRARINATVWWLAIFLLWAIISWSIGLSTSGLPILSREALLGPCSLLVGIAFYLAARRLLRLWPAGFEYWLTVGSLVTAGAALLQFLGHRLPVLYPPLLDRVHTWLVLRNVDWVAAGQANGFALEPSWLASFLTLLPIPLLLTRTTVNEVAASGSRSFHLGRTWWILLTLCCAVVAAGSRAGLVAMFAELLVAVMACIWSSAWRRGLLRSGTLLLAISLATWLVHKDNTYVTSLHGVPEAVARLRVGAPERSGPGNNANPKVEGNEQPSAVGQRATDEGIDWSQWVPPHAGPRMAALVAAVRTIHVAPLTGVGLGLSGAWAIHYLPTWSLQADAVGEPGLREINRWRTNPLSYRVLNRPLRILLETGLVGLTFYLLFFFGHLRWRGRSRADHMLLLCALPAIAIDWLSMDTFALGHPWLLLVLLQGEARKQYSDSSFQQCTNSSLVKEGRRKSHRSIVETR